MAARSTIIIFLVMITKDVFVNHLYLLKKKQDYNRGVFVAKSIKSITKCGNLTKHKILKYNEEAIEKTATFCCNYGDLSSNADPNVNKQKNMIDICMF